MAYCKCQVGYLGNTTIGSALSTDCTLLPAAAPGVCEYLACKRT